MLIAIHALGAKPDGSASKGNFLTTSAVAPSRADRVRGHDLELATGSAHTIAAGEPVQLVIAPGNRGRRGPLVRRSGAPRDWAVRVDEVV